ncbi:hypothetical protein KPY62_09060 [Psychrobacter sp. TAE2020]|uniref:hypothetical protein n=1 Tax=Psychrobacter sp. TAE2020 TaxID=2846762 RepID=UPI001C0FF0FE|nr:hypothetical protein [Psychrobacter sp. TAE2020]MBU5617233.1 hypothetical protein [Psychrobacter sp. TAE2020]
MLLADNRNRASLDDAKNMMHTIWLLQMAYDVAVTRKVIIEPPNRDQLLVIKSGTINYDSLLIQA